MERDLERIRALASYLRVAVYVETIALPLVWIAVFIWALVIDLHSVFIMLLVVGLHWVSAWAALEMMGRATGSWARRGEPPEPYEIHRLLSQAGIVVVGDAFALVVSIVDHLPEARDHGFLAFGVTHVVVDGVFLLSAVVTFGVMVYMWRLMERVYRVRGLIAKKTTEEVALPFATRSAPEREDATARRSQQWGALAQERL
jgi:hypothetical protein